MSSSAVDQSNRRSRFQPTPRSSYLRLGERDVRLLTALSRYRYLSSASLHQLLGGSATTLKWRLRELFDAGLLSRPAWQWELANAMHTPAIYELSARGRKRLEELGLVLTARALASTGTRHFWHTALVCELMAAVEVDIQMSAELTLITEQEILARLDAKDGDHLSPRALRVGSRFVIPDALFGIRSPRGVVLYALEFDRGAEPITRKGPGSTYRDKFDLYRALIGTGAYQRLLSTPAPLVVLHCTTSEARVRSMMKLAHGQHYHLFRAMPQIAMLPTAKVSLDRIMDGAWQYPDGLLFTLR